MIDLSPTGHQIQTVSSFQELVATPFQGEINALCWKRKLIGDFSEIIDKIVLTENIAELGEQELQKLDLTEQGKLARIILLQDLKLLKVHGASPILNVIRYYDRDDSYPFFPTDVYSYHVDRSPIPTDTFLCTYYGESSEILLNADATQKILVPEIRAELRELYDGAENGFETFLSDHFFDLHYQAKPAALPISLGKSYLWRLAVEHPESKVSPCIHRAPKEKKGENRLLLIC